MSLTHSGVTTPPRAPMFAAAVAGFAGALVWAALSLAGGREAWDTALYWTVGIPLFAVAALVCGFIAPRTVWRWPLCLVAGHAVGAALVPGGGGLGLAPLAVLFVGVPLAAILCVPAIIGGVVAHRGWDREILA